MNPVLHVGFNNFVTSDNVVALIDYKSMPAKKIVKSARLEKPRSVIDVTCRKKAQTLIILTGDRYVISAIYRQQLAKRLGAVSVPKEELLTIRSYNKNAFQKPEEIEIEDETTGNTEEA